MASTDPILAALKPLLKARGITCKALGAELGLGDRVRLKVARNLQWRRNGPVRHAYEAKVMPEFLLNGLGASDMHLRFEVREVSRASLALMQRKVDADVSTLKYGLCGSAAMPPELFRRFEAATGVKILEGYGQTETTCLISCNPPAGERKIGSVGLPFPYTEVAILRFAEGAAAPAPERPMT